MGYPFVPIVDCDSIAYSSSGSVKAAEPLNWALNNAKKAMESIQDKFDRGLEMQVFLTGKSNFRDAIAVTQPYKGNRTQPKPPYLPDVRQYLVDMWGAHIVEGREADDTVAIEYLKDPDKRCIVAIDKDLLQIPGNHYNYKKDNLFVVTPEEAARFFYVQLLEGDRTDHIKGLPGIGKAKAPRLIEHCRTEQEMYQIARKLYAEAYAPNGDVVLQEHADLLYIHKKDNDKWLPPS